MAELTVYVDDQRHWTPSLGLGGQVEVQPLSDVPGRAVLDILVDFCIFWGHEWWWFEFLQDITIPIHVCGWEGEVEDKGLLSMVARNLSEFILMDGEEISKSTVRVREKVDIEATSTMGLCKHHVSGTRRPRSLLIVHQDSSSPWL